MKLDERAAKKGKSHARFFREQGSPRKLPIPHNAKAWMLKKKQVSDSENDGTHSSELQTHSSEQQTHSNEQHADHDKIDSERELFSSESEEELDDTDWYILPVVVSVIYMYVSVNVYIVDNGLWCNKLVISVLLCMLYASFTPVISMLYASHKAVISML